MSSASTRFRAAGLLPAALFTLLALVGEGRRPRRPASPRSSTRPAREAWAMRWFAAVATPTMFGVAGETESWSFELALEDGVDTVAVGGAPGRLQWHQGRGPEPRAALRPAGGAPRSAGRLHPVGRLGAADRLRRCHAESDLPRPRPAALERRARAAEGAALLPRRQDRGGHQLSADGSRRRRRPGQEPFRV